MRWWHASVFGLASLLGIACGPDDREPELRCAGVSIDDESPGEPTPGPCSILFDETADGTIDGYETIVYHPLGEPLAIEFGRGDEPTTRMRFGHDDLGRIVWRTQEDATTGTITSRWDREYVSPTTMMITDSDGEGNVTRVGRAQLDDHGEIGDLYTDTDLDGWADWRHLSERDDDGRPLESRTEHRLDDWTPWYTHAYVYDADGFLVETHYDYHRPSTTQHDGITHHTNDAFGNELVAEHIDLVDGEHICSYDHYDCE
jgi:YD repeat-containing protein